MCSESIFVLAIIYYFSHNVLAIIVLAIIYIGFIILFVIKIILCSILLFCASFYACLIVLCIMPINNYYQQVLFEINTDLLSDKLLNQPSSDTIQFIARKIHRKYWWDRRCPQRKQQKDLVKNVEEKNHQRL